MMTVFAGSKGGKGGSKLTAQQKNFKRATKALQNARRGAVRGANNARG